MVRSRTGAMLAIAAVAGSLVALAPLNHAVASGAKSPSPRFGMGMAFDAAPGEAHGRPVRHHGDDFNRDRLPQPQRPRTFRRVGWHALSNAKGVDRCVRSTGFSRNSA